MAQPDLDFFRKRNLLLKVEAVEGTDSVPVGGTDAIRLFDGNSSTEYDAVERPMDKAFFGNDPFGVANRRARIEGDFEVYPPPTPGAVATSDADCGRILLCAGMAVTKDAVNNLTIYNPISSALQSYTGYWTHTGVLTKVLGSRADISGLAIQIGERFKGRASIMGDYTEVVAAANPTVTLPTKVPVIASARNTRCWLSTLVRGATASTDAAPLSDLLVWSKSLSIDMGNQLAHKEYSSTSVNGLSDRRGTFTLRIAKTDITNDFNPWYVRDNGIVLEARMATYEVSGTQSSVLTGLYAALNIRGQIEQITPTDIDGDHGWEITGRLIPSDTGGDEFTVEFGDAA